MSKQKEIIDDPYEAQYEAVEEETTIQKQSSNGHLQNFKLLGRLGKN